MDERPCWMLRLLPTVPKLSGFLRPFSRQLALSHLPFRRYHPEPPSHWTQAEYVRPLRLRKKLLISPNLPVPQPLALIPYMRPEPKSLWSRGFSEVRRRQKRITHIPPIPPKSRYPLCFLRTYESPNPGKGMSFPSFICPSFFETNPMGPLAVLLVHSGSSERSFVHW